MHACFGPRLTCGPVAPLAAQVKWKDLLTDLNLVPAELTPERYQAENELVRLVKAVTPNKKVQHRGPASCAPLMPPWAT